MYLDVDPKVGEFQRLLAQIDILQQKLIKIWPRDIPMCDVFPGRGTATPPGVEFGRTRIRFHPAGHKEKRVATTNSICRLSVFFYKKKHGDKQKWDSIWAVGHFGSWID